MFYTLLFVGRFLLIPGVHTLQQGECQLPPRVEFRKTTHESPWAIPNACVGGGAIIIWHPYYYALPQFVSKNLLRVACCVFVFPFSLTTIFCSSCVVLRVSGNADGSANDPADDVSVQHSPTGITSSARITLSFQLSSRCRSDCTHRRDCHSAAPPRPLQGVSIGMDRGCQQNDNLADGYL